MFNIGGGQKDFSPEGPMAWFTLWSEVWHPKGHSLSQAGRLLTRVVRKEKLQNAHHRPPWDSLTLGDTWPGPQVNRADTWRPMSVTLGYLFPGDYSQEEKWPN